MDNYSKTFKIEKIKFGNPGIRTKVWSKMSELYGREIGTLIGLNMDLAIQVFNQGLVTPLEQSLPRTINTDLSFQREKKQFKKVIVE